MSSRAYHHGDLRAALLQVGLRLLASGDANDLSLREMARAVDVSATAVYRHFPDKKALMAALAVEGLSMLARAQHQASEAAGGGVEGFNATGRAYVRFALANPALFRLIFSNPARVGAPLGVGGRARRHGVPARQRRGAFARRAWTRRPWRSAHGRWRTASPC